MVYLDFDGTLIDLWPRYYAVFKNLVGIGHITLEEYKKAKQEYVKDSLVALSFGKRLPSNYFENKAVFLEEKENLSLDRLLFSPAEVNAVLQKDTVILTKRRYPEHLYWELNQLGIQGNVKVVDQTHKKDWISASSFSESITMIGDSMEDLETAVLPYVEAWMVGYGLCTKEQFDAEKLPYRYFSSPMKMFYALKRKVCLSCNFET